MITFESVTKKYPDGTVAVGGLSLEAPTGQTTVFVGPSGCGKTTSLRMINRMIEPTGGRILVDGEDTAKVDSAKLRRSMGYVIQHAGLFPHRTIQSNIATVPLLLGTNRREAEKQALELMERVGLSTSLAKRYPAQLSGGQQQRVGVARALAANPPIMLMDEPFSAVDPIVREQLQDEFLRLQADLGKTIVFVTHDIDEAIKLGDQVVVLQVGGVVAQMAAPASLLIEPADDFVADFVGRDRGYRTLGFRTSAVPVTPEPTILLGATQDDARRAATGQWVLVVNDEGHPLGWVEPEKVQGTAALSSPSGRGVIVDRDGVLRGTVLPSVVITVIEAVTRAASSNGDGSGDSHVNGRAGVRAKPVDQLTERARES